MRGQVQNATCRPASLAPSCVGAAKLSRRLWYGSFASSSGFELWLRADGGGNAGAKKDDRDMREAASRHARGCQCCARRLDAVDFDVLVHTNVLTEGGYADEEPLEARAATHARLFARLTDPDRQRAVVNLDGDRACRVALG